MDTKPYCEYNCDYPCSMCLENAKKAQKVSTNPLLDDDEEMDLPWYGYTGGDPGVFPIKRFTDEGYEIGTPATPVKPYEPPPFKELQVRRIVEAKEIDIVGPTNLKKRSIVIN